MVNTKKVATIKLNPKLVKIFKPVHLAFGILGVFIIIGSLWGALFLINDPAKGDLGMFVLIIPAFGLFIGSMFAYQGFSIWKMRSEDISVEINNKK